MKKIHKMVLNDRLLKLNRLFTENLNIRKLGPSEAAFAYNVQKQIDEDASTECLAKFRRNRNEYLRRFITMDET